MKKTIAIIAPDTDSGKTIVTAALATLLKEAGITTAIMKPLQTGSSNNRSEDLDYILNKSDIHLTPQEYSWATPYTFPLACSPHLAAKEAKEIISFSIIQKSLENLQQLFDIILIESAGGIMSPLSLEATNLTLIKELSCDVIIVIPNKLGAISQALSTISLLQISNIPILGVIYNEPREELSTLDIKIINDNIKTIEKFTHTKTIGRLKNISHNFHTCVRDSLPQVLSYILGKDA